MKTQKIKVPYSEALEMGKAAKQVQEILKKGNVTYPKATFKNIYDALIFLGQQIDQLKKKDITNIERVEARERTSLTIDKPGLISARYGIGVKTSNGWGIIHGPFASFTEALGIQGHNGAYILRLSGNSDEPVIIDRWQVDRWVAYIS